MRPPERVELFRLGKCLYKVLACVGKDREFFGADAAVAVQETSPTPVSNREELLQKVTQGVVHGLPGLSRDSLSQPPGEVKLVK